MSDDALLRRLAAADRFLNRFGRHGIVGLSLVGALLVGALDYLTGYEISMSLFYLGPVALATWYGGRRAGIGIALISCFFWYGTQLATGNPYSNSVIPVWNALIRFGFFFITSSLLTALRDGLVRQQQLARTDALTGLYGRRAFEERLEHQLAMAQRRKTPLTLAYVDLDNFKLVNDTLGHAEGDRVLRTTGQVLKKTLRKTDTAARLGGDEFALLLPESDGHGAKRVVENLVDELREAFSANGRAVTCSIGVVSFLEPARSAAEVLAAADALMYEVKRRGRAAIAFRVVGGAFAEADREGGAAKNGA
ncbi:MAG: putative diguanylate cyclase YcdT [Candidatus Accumulibacter appositus]|uniref:diguanylate cyclase n=1 Tax=Candidatus Accumulibacter appositus TaxID=1454003 RepID=A0A011P2L1_9PROT|nr:diguanylate cyclase [Accumulibacter sp.]EXI81846.1 MAG: putative diguanylate cyclase YcdT [Candidatus Accumulibacter appositus]HRF04342.1 diguanylate cyclase [Accumulibacter sp.]